MADFAATMANISANPVSTRRFLWPWFVLGFFFLGVLLTIVAVRKEAQRVKSQRMPVLETPATNSVR